MANSRPCQPLPALLILMLLGAASQSNVIQMAAGSPTPVIKSDTPVPQQQSTSLNVKLIETPAQSNSLNQLPALITQQQQQKANVADKLKRGLSNFINHFNPAPFFVPPNSQPTTQEAGGSKQQVPGAKSTSTREPPTIINDGPSADAVIKGPNRLVQARPLGGPLRWG